jgi:hypothetical protein
VCELQQLPQLSGLVVVELGLLGEGRNGVSHILLLDGRETGLPASQPTDPFQLKDQPIC